MYVRVCHRTGLRVVHACVTLEFHTHASVFVWKKELEEPLTSKCDEFWCSCAERAPSFRDQLKGSPSPPSSAPGS